MFSIQFKIVVNCNLLKVLCIVVLYLWCCGKCLGASIDRNQLVVEFQEAD